jgi:hypothetical protein
LTCSALLTEPDHEWTAPVWEKHSARGGDLNARPALQRFFRKRKEVVDPIPANPINPPSYFLHQSDLQ